MTKRKKQKLKPLFEVADQFGDGSRILDLIWDSQSKLPDNFDWYDVVKDQMHRLLTYQALKLRRKTFSSREPLCLSSSPGVRDEEIGTAFAELCSENTIQIEGAEDAEYLMLIEPHKVFELFWEDYEKHNFWRSNAFFELKSSSESVER